MRTLTLEEVNAVSAAGVQGDITESSAFGGTLGTVIGFVITDTVAGATRGGLAGAALGFAWGIGYQTGTALYEYFCR